MQFISILPSYSQAMHPSISPAVACASDSSNYHHRYRVSRIFSPSRSPITISSALLSCRFADPSRESDEHRINLPDDVYPILPPDWLTRVTESLNGRASLHTTNLRGCEEGER